PLVPNTKSLGAARYRSSRDGPDSRQRGTAQCGSRRTLAVLALEPRAALLQLELDDRLIVGVFNDVGGDLELSLEALSIPSYVLDRAGIVRWINPATERLLGDVRGRHYTSIVAPEDRARAQVLFTRKVLGNVPATDASGFLLSSDGKRVSVE